MLLLATGITVFLVFCQLFPGTCHAKYVRGHLKTLDDWAFLARFCFISGKGRYEYEIEFDRRYGEPQLLLYYDDNSQWPSVYKSGKTCREKLSVLSADDNQIVTLSSRSPHNTRSGCTISKKSTPIPLTPSHTTEQPYNYDTTTQYEYSENASTEPSFDRFLKSTQSTDGIEQATNESNIDETDVDFSGSGDQLESFNDTEVFNVSKSSSRRHGGGLSFKHDTSFENELENSTEFRSDVEELFESQIESHQRSEDFAEERSGGHSEPLIDGNIFYRARETYTVRCHNAGTFISSRERWWYIAISNCGTNKGLDVTYRFKMTNGQPGDFWNEHFSADERLIPQILLLGFIAYTLLLVALFLCTVELRSLHLYHCTYRLFGLSVILEYFGILVHGMTWTRYGFTGYGPHPTLGNLLMSASEIAYLLLLLIMAKGYTITRARLSSCSIVRLTMFINIYIVVYIILFVYQAEAFDPGEVLNLYESPAGFGLSVLRSISWSAFMVSTATTIKKNPEKGSFYYPFGLLGSCWILGGPFLTLVGVNLLDAWVRESVMFATFFLLSFCGHSIFLWLTWPSRANKSFPYHVKTNHVGIASDEDDGADYPRHTYEPTHVDQNIIIPLSRRTEELINGIYGQYAYEGHRCGSNAHSHASFPDDKNTSPEILSASRLGRNGSDRNGSDRNFPQHANGDASQPQSCTMVNEYEDENQNDSGHLSLEQSGSPSNNTTKSMSDNGTPAHGRKPSTHTIESNQFVNDMKPPPNKIILEPITQSIQNMKLPAIVPRHLFAAKKSPE